MSSVLDGRPVSEAELLAELEATTAHAEALLSRLGELQSYESEKFVKVPKEALYDSGLSGNALRVLCLLIDMGNPVHGGAFPSAQTLCDRGGISCPKTVRRAVVELEEAGHLVKENRFVDGRQRSNFYHLAAFKGRPDYKKPKARSKSAGKKDVGSVSKGSNSSSKSGLHVEAVNAWELYSAAFREAARGSEGVDVFAGLGERTRLAGESVRVAMKTLSEKDCRWRFINEYKKAAGVDVKQVV